MKSFLLFVLCTLVLTSLPLEAINAQDPIDQYEGIPLIIYPGLRADSIIYPLHYQQMDSMGVYAVVVPDVFKFTPGISYLQRFKNHNLKVIPAEIWSDSIHNQIFRYTDSHYSIWKAAGVTDTSNGKASLIRSSNTTVVNNVVIASPSYTPSGDTIVKGPGYSQNTKYRLSDDTVFYHIKFGMKIEQTIPNLPQNFMDDVVCKVMVTTIATDTSEEVPVCSTEVRVSDFGDWGNWINVSDDYNLIQYSFDMPVRQGIAGTDSWWQPISYYVQFKIVWEGLSYLDLYVDTVKVYDDRGINIVEKEIYQFNISNLVQSYINDPYIIGWYGLDEPLSIDNYEPYRVVDSIIQSVNGSQIRLHAGLTTGWNGQYGNFTTGTHPLYPAEEFWLRAKPKNIEVNLYNYHYPYKPWLGHPAHDPLWQTKNIEYVTDLNLDKINDFDTSFAFSTQAGAYFDYDSNCNLTDTLLSYPSTRQINYHINLGLMYGAKELRLDPFFSYINCLDKYRTAGLIDKNNDTTANYNFFRFTIVPRLNGSFGKELKKIHQVVQHPHLQLPKTQPINSTYNWLTSISYLNGDGSSGADFIDVGFFETHFESNDVPYFMVVNRWYNTAGQGGLLRINIDKTGTGYTNYNVTNFIENTKQTIVNSGFVTMPHIPGEARLFKVYPVLKDGGSMVVSETTHPNDILLGDLTIENGATLTVNGTYYAKANITVKSGGKIIAGQNASINFDPGKKLIVEGIVEVKGTSDNNNLTIAAGADQAILVKSGSSFTLNYCTILAPHTGIETETGSQSYVNISNTHITAARTGISLIGGTQENGFFTTPPSVIYKCNITTSLFYGISAANFASILVQENTLINCGMSISNVTSAFIQSNNISTGTNSDQPGIFFNNSNGYIRNNTVKNRANGIHLANSSPDIGGNLIENNYLHGIYIG
ncbi:MAG: hypothetical protein IH620_06835, partial [Ignavibacterium sp.]|nr:hypothetical protein [Ignavibacterium sp.]